MENLKNIQERLAEKIPAKSIELRVGSKLGSSGNITVLCYKDARMDANRLDEIVGCFNWQREHYTVDGVNYCRVGIKNPDNGEWVWKSDAGSESKTEAEKGAASDAFKRACFQWGIGRELYNMPLIIISSEFGKKLQKVEIKISYFKGTRIPAVVGLFYEGQRIFLYIADDAKTSEGKFNKDIETEEV